MLVYKIINLKNDKVYFSATSKKINIAWSIQKSAARMNRKKMKLKDAYTSKSPLHEALINYGEWNFDYEVIARNLSKKEAYKLKEHLIKEHKSNNPIYGYNCTTGGESYKINKETIKKQSESNMGKIMPESFVDMMKKRKGKLHPCYGYKHSKETKENMRLAQLNSDYVHTQEHKRKIGLASKKVWSDEKFKQKMSKKRKEMGLWKGKNNPMYGKSRKGKDNPMYGRIGKLNPQYGKVLPKEHFDKLQKGRIEYLSKRKSKLLEDIKDRTEKKCNKCNKIKPLNEYYKNSRTLDFLCYVCKKCDKKRRAMSRKQKRRVV